MIPYNGAYVVKNYFIYFKAITVANVFTAHLRINAHFVGPTSVRKIFYVANEMNCYMFLCVMYLQTCLHGCTCLHTSKAKELEDACSLSR